ncbi:MAG: hypothetical protein KC994_00825 [Candidatus Omnitrophica bacterium]|nr:hypothetical protein [Candidatus Omnitrophota bacterium]
MFKNVELSDDLLNIVNTKTFFVDPPDHPDVWFRYVVVIGTISLVALAAAILTRIFHAEDLPSEFSKMGLELRRVLQSTLLTRLCLICGMIVIPLVFYVNTKEHYWTAKHTAMLFTGFLGLCSWMAVREWVPRFRTPYAWPVGLILISATLSTFRAVNIAEGIGYLFAIFGSAVFFFLASQVFSTSKRIHLIVLTLGLVAIVMSMYGLCQSYLLLPSEYVYAQETRAPVSTIGNKNYAAYYLDLAIPLALALAVCRRGPKQTLLALAIFFVCRWHFTLCDTRGGTIAMTVGILTTIAVVAYFHGRRFRLLLYAVLLEPLLWAAMSAAKITYGDAQNWGAMLDRKEFKGQIGDALRASLPEDFRQATSILQTAYLKANEVALGVNLRTWALVLGVLIALGVFWYVVKSQKNWRLSLGVAAGLAFLPYLFAMLTMPNLSDSRGMAVRVMNYARNADSVEFGPSGDVVVQLLERYKTVLVEAARNYNELFLTTHQGVAAMMSLSLFVMMATFLLYRYYDDEEGWLPGFAIAGAIGGWFLIFLILCPGDSFLDKFGRMDGIWPKDLRYFHKDHPLLGLLFTRLSFALYTVLGLIGSIFVTQWIPAHMPKEQAWELGAKAKGYARYAIPAFGLFLLLLFCMTDRVQSAAKDAWVKTHEDGIIQGAFEGAHRFFNTQDQDKDIPRDGAIGFRLEIYQSCFRKIQDSWNWLLGIGPGNFKVVHPYPQFETALERRILGKEVLGRKAHNDFLEDAVENGIFGFLGLVWMFSLTGYLLFHTLKRIHPPRDASDVFMNTITWGLCCSMTAILIHAQFEAPLLQPASTYPCWMLFGVVFQLYRVQKRRTTRAIAGLPGVVYSEDYNLSGSKDKFALPPSAAAYELPPTPPKSNGVLEKLAAPSVAWPVALVVVTLITGSVLLRQYVGEMWLRWGMIFSQSGVERYEDIFECMEKAQDIYPQQMETNYILGRYCIDATQLALPVWEKLNGPSRNVPSIREAAEKQAAQLRERYQLDADKVIDYAKLGVKVHERDIYMNPNYKWAHNNMGVLCDKLSQIYEIKAMAEDDPDKKSEFQKLSADYEEESRNCYRKALEIDDLQVYALFNLGIGAYRDGNLERALKFFEKTLLADPGKGDVNLFIAKCRFALDDMKGGVEAIRDMFAWEERHPRNKNRKEGEPEVQVIKASERQELEELLSQVGRVALSTGDLETARLAAETLVDQVNRCEYLPLLARVEADSGDARKAIELGQEADTRCDRDALSAESYYAQAKAYCMLEQATPAIEILNTLMANAEVARHFEDLLRTDKAFEFLKGSDFYDKYIADEKKQSSSSEASMKPAESATQTTEEPQSATPSNE